MGPHRRSIPTTAAALAKSSHARVREGIEDPASEAPGASGHMRLRGSGCGPIRDPVMARDGTKNGMAKRDVGMKCHSLFSPCHWWKKTLGTGNLFTTMHLPLPECRKMGGLE